MSMSKSMRMAGKIGALGVGALDSRRPALFDRNLIDRLFG